MLEGHWKGSEHMRAYNNRVWRFSLAVISFALWPSGNLVMPFLCLDAKPDNLTHIEIERGSVFTLVGPYLVSIVTRGVSIL